MAVSRKYSYKYISHIKKVTQDFEKKDRELVHKAAKHGEKAIKAKIGRRRKSRPGEPPGKFSGNLFRGIKTKTGRARWHPYSYVGAVSPAYHAHLLEFGTRKMRARPVILPTLIEEAPAMKRILAEVRV
ncbi:hypothetical protein GWN91_05890 [Candidatus Saccharibacteria bacterium]|nr:hypothetical protein [Candidatus Saccharibacteria bacterium]NIS38667.1 hypothetical protein [Candidatus Saccharibacteria bacterium]NIV04110.1 hypothetical protein [Calditrichia bacterium]NIV72514.1 hypothetical protein [Calditrichia bacterium]